MLKEVEGGEQFREVTAEIGRIWRELESALSELRAAIVTAEPLFAMAFELPAVDEDDERSSLDAIPVSRFHGKKAQLFISSSYMQVFAQFSTSRKLTARFPGVLQFPAADYAVWGPRIAAINAIKNNLQQVVTTLPTNKQRYDAINSQIPWSITTSLYRNINLFAPGEVQARHVSFLWVNSAGIRKTSKDVVVRKLQRLKERVPDGVEPALWRRRLDTDIDHVTNLDESVYGLRIKRHVPAVPMINVQDTKGEWTQFGGHLPLFVFSDEELGITPLLDYSSDRRRIDRADRQLSTLPLVEILNVYVVRL